MIGTTTSVSRFLLTGATVIRARRGPEASRRRPINALRAARSVRSGSDHMLSRPGVSELLFLHDTTRFTCLSSFAAPNSAPLMTAQVQDFQKLNVIIRQRGDDVGDVVLGWLQLVDEHQQSGRACRHLERGREP